MFDGIMDSMDMNSRKLWEVVKDREAWNVAFHGVTKNWIWPISEQQQLYCSDTYIFCMYQIYILENL